MWGESICLTIEPSVPVCFEVRDEASEDTIKHNSGCAPLKLQREEQTILLAPARQGGHGPAYITFHMPELDVEGIWPPPAAPALPPPPAASIPPRDICLAQLGASGLPDRGVQSTLQLLAFTQSSITQNGQFESSNEAKLRGRTIGTSASSGRADWADRVCLSVSEEICFELHAADQGGAEVANENQDCWTECDGKNGACLSDFCGSNGACCRTGWGISRPECGFGALGCSTTHCCKAASAAQPVTARGCGRIDPNATGEQTVTIPLHGGSGAGSVVVRFEVDARCAPCEPRSLPTLVLPFFEDDICKMKLTAQSIAVHGKRAFSQVYLVWLSTKHHSDYQGDLDELKRLAEPVGVPVHLMDFSPYMFKVNERNSDVGGWMVQQMFKLAMGYLVETDHYVVFDSKNHIVRELQPGEFVNDCNQAVIAGEMRLDRMRWGWHQAWYKHSAGCLDIAMTDLRLTSEHGDVLLPHSITPFVMNAATVRDMHTRHNYGVQPPSADAAARLVETNGDWDFPYWSEMVDATEYLIDWFNSRGCTEFTSYELFAYFGDVGESCLRSRHAVQPFVEWSSSIWGTPFADTFGTEQQLLRAYAQAPELHPDWQVIGFQRGWNSHYPDRANLLGMKHDLFKIFQRSGILLRPNQSADDVWNLAQGTAPCP